MSTKFNSKHFKVTRQKPYSLRPYSLVTSTIIGGVFLSLSEISGATDTDSLQLLPFDKSPLITQNVLIASPQSTIKSGFIRTIRDAIAAKWQRRQLDNLIAVIVAQPLPDRIYKSYTPDTGNSLKPFIGQNLFYDSNVLRVAKNSDAAKIVGDRDKSDFIKQIRAGIAAKWSFHRQLLLVNALVSQNWYSTYKELDYLGRDIQVQWNWQLGHYLTGEIGYNNKVSQGNFSQLNALINNLQTTHRYFASGEYQFASDWFLQGGFTQVNTSYQSALLQNNSLVTNASMVGLKYLTPYNNRVGIKATLTDGKFPQRQFFAGDSIDNAYTRNDFDFEWGWQYSIKTRFEGRVGYTQQNFKHLPVRDFSAPTVNANLNWDITSKSALRLTGWRDIQFVNNLNANFILSQGIKILPIWLPTTKLQLTLPLSYENQDYLGDPGFSGQTASAEQDKVSKIGLTVDYNPFEKAKMSLFMQFEDRSSTNLSRNYQSTGVGLDMQVDF